MKIQYIQWLVGKHKHAFSFFSLSVLIFKFVKSKKFYCGSFSCKMSFRKEVLRFSTSNKNKMFFLAFFQSNLIVQDYCILVKMLSIWIWIQFICVSFISAWAQFDITPSTTFVSFLYFFFFCLAFLFISFCFGSTS